MQKASTGLQEKTYSDALVSMLIDTFFELAGYAQNAIRRALGSVEERQGDPSNMDVDYDGDAAVPKELDLLLPKVSEALVLVSQCLTTLSLGEAEHAVPSAASIRATLAAAHSASGEGLVESVVGAHIHAVRLSLS